MKLTVLYNNVPFESGLKTAWGFACMVEGPERTILFDTGGDGRILLSNMLALGLDPAMVDWVVLSHNHGDHTGGLPAFLNENPHVTVYAHDSFPGDFMDGVRRAGARVVAVSAPTEIAEGVHTTGPVGGQIVEQSLLVASPEGLTLITGCAHPGIVQIADRARQWLGRDISLAVGGFHLMRHGGREAGAIAAELKEMGVRKIGPSHCTGDFAVGAFRGLWRDDFVDAGCGAFLQFPEPNP